MIFRQITPRVFVILLLGLISVLFSAKIIICQSNLIPILSKTWTKKQIESMVGRDSFFEVGSLVMVQQDVDKWNFALIKNHTADGSYLVQLLNKNSAIQVPVGLIRTVAPFWQLLFQSRVNQKKLLQLIDEQVQYVHKQGVPEGYSCIVPTESNVIVLTDPQGNVECLRRQLVDLYNKGLIDSHCTLKSDCYLVFMAPNIENIEKAQDVIYVLLSIARHNEGRVFILGNQTTSVNPENILDNTATKNLNFTSSLSHDTIAMSKLVALWKILPRMILMGIQMPSTHSYDFVMLCREKKGYVQEPKKLLDNIVKGHIDSNYQKNYTVPYNAKDNKKIIPANTTSFSYTLCAMIAGSKKQAANGGIIRLLKNGAKTHKPLKEGKIYQVSSCKFYKCSSSEQTQFFGIIHAGNNGHWYITSHAA